MACTLSPSVKGGIDFEGKSGNNFTVTIVPAAGSTLVMTAATYNGVTVGGSTATFPVAKGKVSMVVVYAAAKFGERGDLTENCPGGGTTALRGIKSTGVFARQYVIEGA